MSTNDLQIWPVNYSRSNVRLTGVQAGVASIKEAARAQVSVARARGDHLGGQSIIGSSNYRSIGCRRGLGRYIVPDTVPC